MTDWLRIEHAPKDGTEIDAWVSLGDSGYRVANAKWGRYVDFAKHGDLQEHDGWVYWSDRYEGYVNLEEPPKMVVNHFMPIPKGPLE